MPMHYDVKKVAELERFRELAAPRSRVGTMWPVPPVQAPAGP